MNSPTKSSWRTIGQLAKAAGLPTSTLRYYERAGLLAPSSRSAAGYRTYDARSLDRLQAIRLAQRAGLSLADIKELSDLQGERGFYDAMRRRLAKRLEDVDQRLAELHDLRGRIEQAMSCCQTQANCPTECRTFAQSLPEACGTAARQISAGSGGNRLDLAPECKR